MNGRILARVGGAVLMVFLSASTARADLIVTSMGGPLDATALANLLVAGGGGITIDSATYTGASGASGTFSGGGDIVGIDEGILLTSGSVNNMVGPNTSNEATTDNGLAGDADLNGLTTSTTFDASVLEISFTPTGDSVEFSYVFGSEEYLEYVNSSFNDVFGFFVNGQNFALLPGTTTAVAINNVNHLTNTSFFIDNESFTTAPNANLNTQLDGLTVVLSFVAPVNPGVENTLKLAIADAGDRVLDSGVFIAAGSFKVCGEPPLPPCGGGDDGGGGDTVPEPAALALMGIGALGFVRRFRRRLV